MLAWHTKLAGHACPQPPQWAGFELTLVSQPFVSVPSQLPNPRLHISEHMPLPQLAIPLVELHTLPQLPQLTSSFLVFASQPSSITPDWGPLQSEKAPVHV